MYHLGMGVSVDSIISMNLQINHRMVDLKAGRLDLIRIHVKLKVIEYV